MTIGSRHWAIGEGYIPAPGNDDDDPRFESHEAACLLNVNDVDAHVTIMLYFGDREPVGPYCVTVPARRTLHLRFNDLTDPAPVPRETDYASVFFSDVQVVLQHTRLDSRRPALALLSTIAFAENGSG